MRRVLLIGIGTGDPALVTQQAIAALNEASVFFLFDKGEEKEELLAVRRAICDRYITKPGYRFVSIESPQRDECKTYLDGVDAWHEERAKRFRSVFEREVADGGVGAFLVWGDPAFYDSTIRVVDRALAGVDFDVRVEVIPGISSIQLLAARHRIGLNEIGGPIHITTGRKLKELGAPPRGTSVVVMLDGELACRALIGRGLQIYWGAALGGPDETIVAGRLDEVLSEIERARASIKAKHGWVMDTYVLRNADAV